MYLLLYLIDTAITVYIWILIARVVLSSDGRVPADARVFRDDGAPVFLYVAGVEAASTAHLPAHVIVVPAPGPAAATIDLDAVLHDLGARGTQCGLAHDFALQRLVQQPIGLS